MNLGVSVAGIIFNNRCQAGIIMLTTYGTATIDGIDVR